MLRLYRSVISKMQQAGLPPEIIDHILIESGHIKLCWLHSKYVLEKTCQKNPYTCYYYDRTEIAKYNKSIIKYVIWFGGIRSIDLLLESICINHYKLFKYLLEYELYNEEEITNITELKYEIMYLITKHNRKKMFIKMLVKLNDCQLFCDNTIISAICKYNRVGIFKALLSREYYPSGRNYVIEVVFDLEDTDVVNFILTHKLYDLKHDLEENLLYNIIEADHYELFELLIKKRHLHNADFSYNDNLLIKTAVINECTEIVGSLLGLPSAYGIDVMVVEDGVDLLQMALNNNDIYTLELLLERVSKNKKDIKKFKQNYKLHKYEEILHYAFVDEMIMHFIERTLNVTFPYYSNFSLKF